jgi:hypothetical protein
MAGAAPANPVRWGPGSCEHAAAMSFEGQRRAGRVLRGVVLAVPLALAAFWLLNRPVPAASRFDEALDRAVAPVMQQTELQKKLGAITSTQARLLSRELAERSVPYLGPRDLELWAATRLRVARASKPACARLWKGGDDALLRSAIGELDSAPRESYTQMLARGLALRLERKPVPALVPGVIERGFAVIAEQLPPDARRQFQADVHRSDVSDARACELFLTLSNGAEKLEPSLRVDFYRALASALEVRPSSSEDDPR